MTYELKVLSDSDSDVQPEVASLNHPSVEMVEGIDTDRALVTLRGDADRNAFVDFMESDPGVKSYAIPDARDWNDYRTRHGYSGSH